MNGNRPLMWIQGAAPRNHFWKMFIFECTSVIRNYNCSLCLPLVTGIIHAWEWAPPLSAGLPSGITPVDTGSSTAMINSKRSNSRSLLFIIRHWDPERVARIAQKLPTPVSYHWISRYLWPIRGQPKVNKWRLTAFLWDCCNSGIIGLTCQWKFCADLQSDLFLIGLSTYKLSQWWCFSTYIQVMRRLTLYCHTETEVILHKWKKNTHKLSANLVLM